MKTSASSASTALATTAGWTEAVVKAGADLRTRRRVYPFGSEPADF
jgi:hypothetical protein